MKRHVLFSLAALAALAIGGLLATPRAEASYPGAANVSATPQCMPDGTVALTVNWVSYSDGPQWVDVSLNNNNFASGTYGSIGPVPSGIAATVLDELPANAYYYLRVNTFIASYGWLPSETAAIATQACTTVAANAIGTAPVFTGAASVSEVVGTAVAFPISATGSPFPAFSLTGALPAGLVFSDNGNGTALISGAAVAGTGGVYVVTLTATNGVAPDASMTLTISVSAAPAPVTSGGNTIPVTGGNGTGVLPGNTLPIAGNIGN